MRIGTEPGSGQSRSRSYADLDGHWFPAAEPARAWAAQGAGRVVARANSLDGPIALVADVPITVPAAAPGRERALLHASRRPSPSRSAAPR